MTTETITFREYDPNWPERFETESAKLKGALGDECVGVHHVGSTAVPGLAAKPIIDMAVEIREYPPSVAIVSMMDSLGYESMGECSVPGRRWFRKGRPRAFHVHMVPAGGEVVSCQLAFRDYLRKHPSGRREYESLKRRVAGEKHLEIDSSEYAAAKAPFIEKALRQQADAANSGLAGAPSESQIHTVILKSE